MSTPVSLKLLTDAVVASYIHEISTRHQPEDSSPDDRATSQSSAAERVGVQPDG